MTHNIHTKTGRARLEVRREPYWAVIEKGQHLGYRKTAKCGYWIARLTVNRKHFYFSLPSAQDDHAGAVKEARAWFKMKISGTDTNYTLQQALDDYLKYLESEKSAVTVKLVTGVFNSIPKDLKATSVVNLTTEQLLRGGIAPVQRRMITKKTVRTRTRVIDDGVMCGLH